MTSPTLVTLEKLIRELFEKVENQIEMVAAKIIKDLNTKIDECNCTKELINTLIIEKDKEIVDIPKGDLSGLRNYSLPNDWVGNPELGSSRNPGSLKWPFGITEK